MNKSARGFSLVELLVVIAIISILSTVGFVSFTNAQISARDSRRKGDLKSLQNALELYYQNTKTFPSNPFDSSQAGWNNFLGSNQQFINQMPQDPSYGKNDGNNLPFRYGYTSLTNSGGAIIGYRLCANLENNSDKDRNVDSPAVTTVPPQNSCMNDTTRWGDFKIESQ